MNTLPKPVLYTAVAAVLLALLPWPYAYYQLLRIFMCGVFAYAAYHSMDSGKAWLPWVLGFFAVLYNPIASIHLGREVWSVVNVVTAVVLLALPKFTKEAES